MEKTSKLDNVINYFEKEHSLLSDAHNKDNEEYRYQLTVGLTTTAIVVTIFSTFLKIDLIFSQTSLVEIIIILIAVAVLLNLIFYIKRGWKSYKHYEKRKRIIQLILKRLYYFKLTNTLDVFGVLCQPLIKRIGEDCNGLSLLYLAKTKEENEKEIERLIEYVDIINQINKKIFGGKE